MPLSNLGSYHFTAAERTQVSDAMTTILSVLNAHSINYTPEERQKYGSISEQNKLVVQKVLDYHTIQPHLDCPDVAYPELQADWTSRGFMAGLMSQLVEASHIANNLRIAHDFDCYQTAKQDYDHTKYKKATAGGAGWEGKYNDLKPFFTTNPGGSGDDDEEEPGEDNGGTAGGGTDQ